MSKCFITLFAAISLIAPASLLNAQSVPMLANGKVISWSHSGGQNGSMKIVSANGQYFEVEQTNEKYKTAGVVKLYGAILDNGKRIILLNSQYKEVWDGTVAAKEISGNMFTGGGKYTFKITESVAAPASVKLSGEYQGDHKDWKDKVIFNENGTYKRAVNNDPGTYTFDGKTLVLKWAKWQTETLVQTSPGVFSCPSYKFTLTTSSSSVKPAEPTAPFIQGKTLNWSHSGNQNGTVVVTSVSGTKFTLDQVNAKNKAAGITKLEGELKDGKFYIYNKKYGETWVGTYSNGKVTGKMNNAYDFQISE